MNHAVARKRAMVETHSAGRLHQIPLEFSIEGLKKRYLVREVESSWIELDNESGAENLHFKVLADNGRHFVLIYDEQQDIWEIE